MPKKIPNNFAVSVQLNAEIYGNIIGNGDDGYEFHPAELLIWVGNKSIAIPLEVIQTAAVQAEVAEIERMAIAAAQKEMEEF